MNILKEIINHKLYCFHDEFSKWQDAIMANAAPLMQNGYINSDYIEDVIKCIEEYGPYIVMVPNVAIPHSTDNARGVYKTSVSLMRVKKPVVFDINDKDKDAQLFIMIASCNSEEHLKTIQSLCTILEDENLIERLIECEDENDLSKLISSL